MSTKTAPKKPIAKKSAKKATTTTVKNHTKKAPSKANAEDFCEELENTLMEEMASQEEVGGE